MRKTSNNFNAQARLALQALSTCPTLLDYASYGHLLQYFFNRHLTLQGKQLHARLVLSSVAPHNFLASKLINFYGKAHDLRSACHVFDQIPKPNTFSYNAMLIAYSITDQHKDALNLFSSFVNSYSVDVRPDQYSVTCLLKSLSGLEFRGLRLAKGVHCYVLRNGLDFDLVVGNALITYYSKCDDLVLARKVFDKMDERDVVTWNSMISGYSQGGFYKECKMLFREMMDSSGCKPDGSTVVSILQACGQSKDLVFGMEIHKIVVDSEVKLNILICNALIGVHAKCGSLDYARELFEEMSERDEVTYNSIISGYMDHGNVEEAMKLFGGMNKRTLSTWNAVISGLVQNNRHEVVLGLFRDMQSFGFRPNNVTLASVLPTLSYNSNLKGGKEVHAYALKIGQERNVYVATSLIDTYAKSGFLHGAQRVFDQSVSRSLIIWTAIISGYAAHGDANSALRLFNEMIYVGIQPDKITFVVVLDACAHCGMVDEAWKIFNAMSGEHGIQPSVEHYACMVGVLSRAGKLSDAKQLVSSMPVKPNAKIWGALLDGASVVGDVELGEIVFDHLVEIEPESSGNYVVMANLYSQAGRWKEADQIREMMNEMGLKKEPGSSWTDKKKLLHC